MILVHEIEIPALPSALPRRAYVYLPKGYFACDRRYPVVYAFDGHNVFFDSHATFGKSWGMKEYLENSGRQLIVAAVECNREGNERLSEYAPWDMDIPGFAFIPSRGKETMDWFTTVFKPKIDRIFRTLPGRGDTMIFGSSFGGLMALYAAVRYNRVFSRAAALSPSLEVGQEPLLGMIAESRLADPTSVYLDLGGGETENDPHLHAELFRTAQALSAAGAAVAARIVPGALHREADWEKRIPVFMDYLLGSLSGNNV